MNTSTIESYLALEKKLQTLFNETNFCLTHCISQQHSLYEKNFSKEDGDNQLKIPGSYGCCFFEVSEKIRGDDIILKEREKKYGKKSNTIKKKINKLKKYKHCTYHSTKNGCQLPSHRPPACNAYICEDFRKHLEEKYNIEYNFMQVNEVLHATITGMLDKEEILQEEKKLDEMISTIRKYNS